MEKDAILNIVINDIKELDLLMSTFKGKNNIPQTYFRLVYSKLNNIQEELAMLEELNNMPAPANGPEVDATPKPIAQPVAEAANPLLKQAVEISQSHELLSFVEEVPTTVVRQTIPPQQTPTVVDKQPAAIEPLVQQQNTVNAPQTPEQPSTPNMPTKRQQDVPVQTKTEDRELPQNTNRALVEDAMVVKNKNGHSVLGETIGADRKSLNDTIVSQHPTDDLTKTGTPVNDIRKAMGINDRFYFQRELFDNNNTLFNNTLDQINAMSSYNQAYIFLKGNFNWDESLKETEEFLRAVRRRFL